MAEPRLVELLERVAVEADAGDVLNAEEAAALLRIGINQLYEATNRLEIPHRRIGRTLRYSRSGLIRWLGSDQAQKA